jgi:hypothetical protein
MTRNTDLIKLRRQSTSTANLFVNVVNAAKGDATGSITQVLSKEAIMTARRTLSSRTRSYGTRCLALRIARIDMNREGEVTEEEIKLCEEEIDRLATTMETYWTNISVVSALLLTITVGAILNPVNADGSLSPEDASTYRLFYGMAMIVSTAFSITSIFMTVTLYTELTVHMVDLEDKVYFFNNTNARLPEYAMLGAGTVKCLKLTLSSR